MSEKFVSWLEERAGQVAEMEAEGEKLIAAGGDMRPYGPLMKRKAEFLAGLASEARPYLADLPPELREQAKAALGRFSAGAETALSLDSVFYMSALLFPENHLKGQPNDLEKFIETMRNKINA